MNDGTQMIRKEAIVFLIRLPTNIDILPATKLDSLPTKKKEKKKKTSKISLKSVLGWSSYEAKVQKK